MSKWRDTAGKIAHRIAAKGTPKLSDAEASKMISEARADVNFTARAQAEFKRRVISHRAEQKPTLSEEGLERYFEIVVSMRMGAARERDWGIAAQWGREYERAEAVSNFLDNVSAEKLHKDLDGAFSEYNQGNLPELAFVNTIITTMFNQLPEGGTSAEPSSVSPEVSSCTNPICNCSDRKTCVCKDADCSHFDGGACPNCGCLIPFAEPSEGRP